MHEVVAAIIILVAVAFLFFSLLFILDSTDLRPKTYRVTNLQFSAVTAGAIVGTLVLVFLGSDFIRSFYRWMTNVDGADAQTDVAQAPTPTAHASIVPPAPTPTRRNIEMCENVATFVEAGLMAEVRVRDPQSFFTPFCAGKKACSLTCSEKRDLIAAQSALRCRDCLGAIAAAAKISDVSRRRLTVQFRLDQANLRLLPYGMTLVLGSSQSPPEPEPMEVPDLPPSHQAIDL